MKRRKLNTAAFTLVELVVVILIVGIMITVWSSFFYSIQNQTTNRLTQWEVNLFNDSINSLKVSDLYLSEYYNTDDYAVLNSLSKESFIDLYYSIEVIKPVLVNKFDSPLLPLLPSDIWNVSNWYSDIVIALQKCKFLFHTELDLLKKTIINLLMKGIFDILSIFTIIKSYWYKTETRYHDSMKLITNILIYWILL